MEKALFLVHFNGMFLKMTYVAREGRPSNKGRGVFLIKSAISPPFLAITKYKEIDPQQNWIAGHDDQIYWITNPVRLFILFTNAILYGICNAIVTLR